MNSRKYIGMDVLKVGISMAVWNATTRISLRNSAENREASR